MYSPEVTPKIKPYSDGLGFRIYYLIPLVKVVRALQPNSINPLEKSKPHLSIMSTPRAGTPPRHDLY